MKFFSQLILAFTVLTNINLIAQNNSNFVRFPSLNSDGSKIAFTYQGDIWVIPSNGGKPERLTIHQAYDAYPQWSKDNTTIAFTSDRFGNNDIFTIPSTGGLPNRITYHSSSDNLNDFANDGSLLFTTSRNFKQVEWDHELETVSSTGGTPMLLLDAIGEMPSKSPNGKFIAFTMGFGRVTREAYHGSANYEIWLYNTEKKSYSKLTDYDGHDIYPRWGDNSTIYYISSKSGKYNIHKVIIDENGKQIGVDNQITGYEDDGIRYFNISKDGSTIVFERQTDIYKLNLSDNSINKVNIEISSDYRFDPTEYKTFTDKMDEYKVSPNGKYSAFVVRGEIFISENDKDKSRTVNLSNHPYRDQNPAWLNDSTLIFISDREGQNDIYLVKSDDQKESNLFKTLKHKIVRLTETDEEESFPVISPDGNKIAYEIGQGKLVIADIDKNGKLKNEITLLDGWARPGNVSWSPDSKWIAYSLNDLYFNSEIFIQSIDKQIEPINVSMHPRTDGNPVWSKDGSKLAFLSKRNNSDFDVWFVWLKKEDWEKTKTDWDEYEKPKTDKKKKKKDPDSTKVETIKIDTEKIYERLTQVTNFAGDENNIEFAKDGETIFFTAKSPAEKGIDIFSIKWDGKDIKSLTKGESAPRSLTTDKDGKYLYYNSKGKLNRIEIKGEKKESLSFAAKMIINFPKEKEQKFEEAWRALNEGFYDPNFHGQNWIDLKAKYKPWCLSASTDNDFQDMFNIMLGELNASHMAMRSNDEREDLQKEKTGLLGITVEPNKDGVKVTHVVPSSPADKENSKLFIGDEIVSVNGMATKGNINFYSLFTNTSDEKLLLTVIRDGKQKEIVIRPTSSLSNELYDEWVENNSKLVDKYSNGKLGYLHIKSMNMPSFEKFEREFTAKGYGKDGIVIDVRYNGGGWTTDYLMTVLNYKQHAYTIPRGAAKNLTTEKEKFREYYPFGERLPFAAWSKPSIALCNQNSYSNAEIFSHAYKNLGIGKLVGLPTFGAVISTGARSLIDGSYVRMPFRGWFVKADNTNMDFVPAVPDIIVYNNPDSKAKGEDPQLKRAVEELLKDLK
ncbi:MAG: PD40 domain-containing protein [Ignavibacteriales bacterium]|nr:PD40 domain-containing protein [Ignavibacteriales bacterium]